MLKWLKSNESMFSMFTGGVSYDNTEKYSGLLGSLGLAKLGFGGLNNQEEMEEIIEEEEEEEEEEKDDKNNSQKQEGEKINENINTESQKTEEEKSKKENYTGFFNNFFKNSGKTNLKRRKKIKKQIKNPISYLEEDNMDDYDYEKNLEEYKNIPLDEKIEKLLQMFEETEK